jgi:hypothetical protein
MSFSALPAELLDLVLERVKEQDSKYRKRVPMDRYERKKANDWGGRGLEAMASVNKLFRSRSIPLFFNVRPCSPELSSCFC